MVDRAEDAWQSKLVRGYRTIQSLDHVPDNILLTPLLQVEQTVC
jgi:hypothetical protein